MKTASWFLLLIFGFMYVFDNIVKCLSAGLTKARRSLSDERVKVCAEFLHGIKVVKFFAWEASYEQRIQRIRSMELHRLFLENGFFILTFIYFFHILPDILLSPIIQTLHV